MAIYSDINQVDVGVYDKVRVFYKTNKYLGGLIKTFVESHTDRIGRTISIVIPDLQRDDVIKINGIQVKPRGVKDDEA